MVKGTVYPARTLESLMAERKHAYVDILKVVYWPWLDLVGKYFSLLRLISMAVSGQR